MIDWVSRKILVLSLAVISFVAGFVLIGGGRPRFQRVNFAFVGTSDWTITTAPGSGWWVDFAGLVLALVFALSTAALLSRLRSDTSAPWIALGGFAVAAVAVVFGMYALVGIGAAVVIGAIAAFVRGDRTSQLGAGFGIFAAFLFADRIEEFRTLQFGMPKRYAEYTTTSGSAGPTNFLLGLIAVAAISAVAAAFLAPARPRSDGGSNNAAVVGAAAIGAASITAHTSAIDGAWISFVVCGAILLGGIAIGARWRWQWCGIAICAAVAVSGAFHGTGADLADLLVFPLGVGITYASRLASRGEAIALVWLMPFEMNSIGRLLRPATADFGWTAYTPLVPIHHTPIWLVVFPVGIVIVCLGWSIWNSAAKRQFSNNITNRGTDRT